jgi:hypothetical protein
MDFMPVPFFYKLVKEPMIHFLLVGALIFWGFYATNPPEVQNNIIRITDAQIEKMVLTFSREWKRPPTELELKSLLDRHIELEISYREALAMNLDKDDEIIKRRLEQKFKFITEDMAGLYAPTEPELIHYFQQHKQTYLEPELYSFEQIFFDAEKHKNPSDNALQAIHKIETAHLSLNAAKMLGDHFPFEVQFERLTTEDITRSLGVAFTRSLQNSTKNKWVGPISSGYGTHLIYITFYSPPSPKKFQDVRPIVRRDFVYDLQKKYNTQLMQNFRKSYAIEVVVSKLDNNPSLVKKLVFLNHGN